MGVGALLLALPVHCTDVKVDPSLQRKAWGKEVQGLEVDWTVCPEAVRARLMYGAQTGLAQLHSGLNQEGESFYLSFLTVDLKQS